MNEDGWHFPRTEFAEKIYNLLVKGPMQGISIYGPQRTGKTRFFTHDLAPFARRRGHRVIHVDFSQTSNPPLEVLLYEFDRALRSRASLGYVKSLVGSAASKLMGKRTDLSTELKVKTAELKDKAPHGDLFLLVGKCCKRLANDRKPAFLLFDEFPETQKTENGRALIAALRASIQRRRNGLVAVFTASSQAGLRQIFADSRAPFFRFAGRIELPPMSDDFVDHQLKAIKAVPTRLLKERRRWRFSSGLAETRCASSGGC